MAVNEGLMSNSEWVTRSDGAGVATLTLSAPETINALSEAMMAALSEHLTNIESDKDVRVVILRGAGKHFCAGHHLKEMAARRADEDGGLHYFRTLFDTCASMMLRINRLPQPVIAEVSGIATAAGCQLVAACDLAIAAETARFATSGVNIGLFCATPMVALSRNLTRKHALEMLLTGDFIDASRAAEIGLINRVVPQEGLGSATLSMAALIASKTPVAIRAGKKAFYDQLGLDLENAYQLAAGVMANNMMAKDTEAGIAAFIHKQPMPEWRGE